jgi:hypothetical protein
MQLRDAQAPNKMEQHFCSRYRLTVTKAHFNDRIRADAAGKPEPITGVKASQVMDSID